VLVTFVLVAGQLTFGFLESWSRTFLAIATAIGIELVVSRLLFGKWPHLASAYVSGISVGMLIRSPAFWPYALCSAISIVSKYVIRVTGGTSSTRQLRRRGDARARRRSGREPQHPVGEHAAADGGGVDVRVGDLYILGRLHIT
jgi:hypothetical protein